VDPPYENITCPTVLIAGDKDMISPLQRSEDLKALIGGKAWVAVVRSGHQPILEDLSGVTAAVDRLLQRVETES
jgi:3-oxoadipate enol-lactonase